MSEEEEFAATAARNAERVRQLEEHGTLRPAEEKELKIRAAIQRFVTGTTRTDGSWTAINLVEESGIARPTLYRYKRELADFQKLAACAPASAAGLREQLRQAKKELQEEKARSRLERQRHQQVESVLVNRIQALSLLVASALGRNDVPVLFPEFAKREPGDD